MAKPVKKVKPRHSARHLKKPALHARKTSFLAAFADSGNIRLAAAKAQVNRSTHYRWLSDDTAYAEAFGEAHDQAMDLLEQEAWRRGLTGWDEPVFYQGEKCATIRKYDTTLLIFLLKAGRPEKFRERQEVQHSGDITFTLAFPKPTDR